MIDDWWLMSDDWWLMIDDKINTNIIWNGPHIVCLRGDPPWGNLYPTFHIIFVFILSSIISQHSSLINHQSSVNHQLSITNHPWSMINHQSSITRHHFFDIKTHLQTIQKKERKKLSPEARKKKSSAKSLNDINNSERKSAKSYPRRHEKKG